MAYLALVRHGESEWNALDLWSGWVDVPITEKGKRQAVEVAEKIKDTMWDIAYQSDLKRSQQTLEIILNELKLNIPVITAPQIKERDYGNFDGLNKIEIEEKYGYDLFVKWHRSWDYPVPHGETLKDVYARVVPYFEAEILPKLKEGKNVIISAHGNSLRALVKYLDNISDEDIERLEIPVGTVLIRKF